MDRQTVLVVGAAVVVVLAVAGVALTLRARRRTARQLAAARADVSALREQVEALSRRLDEPAARPSDPPAAAGQEFLITSLPSGTDVAVPQQPGAPLTTGRFVSVAAAESAVRLLSLGYGVRRALSAENRNRIRFEVRQEVKRARRQRRRDLKEAKRQVRAQASGGERADLRSDAA